MEGGADARIKIYINYMTVETTYFSRVVLVIESEINVLAIYMT